LNNSFLLQCKENFLGGITPSNKSSYKKPGYVKLTQLAQEYFDNNRYDEFANYFQEGQYLVNLWAAHMIIEYGNTEGNLVKTAINIIRDHTVNPLAPVVAREEKEWLAENSEGLKRYS
jgi:hypothetical protein